MVHRSNLASNRFYFIVNHIIIEIHEAPLAPAAPSSDSAPSTSTTNQTSVVAPSQVMSNAQPPSVSDLLGMMEAEAASIQPQVEEPAQATVIAEIPPPNPQAVVAEGSTTLQMEVDAAAHPDPSSTESPVSSANEADTEMRDGEAESSTSAAPNPSQLSTSPLSPLKSQADSSDVLMDVALIRSSIAVDASSSGASSSSGGEATGHLSQSPLRHTPSIEMMS